MGYAHSAIMPALDSLFLSASPAPRFRRRGPVSLHHTLPSCLSNFLLSLSRLNSGCGGIANHLRSDLNSRLLNFDFEKVDYGKVF